jgi:NitT/TauT family transport system substrate-binding protein
MAAAVLAAGCGDDDGGASGGGGGELEVKVAGIPPFTVTTWPLVVADSEGYFAEEGISVDKIFTFDGGQLLAGGQVDVLNDGADSGLLAANQGQDVIAFAPLANQVTDGVLVNSEITDLAQLEGGTLRTSGAGATDEFLLQQYLDDNGVDSESIEYLPVEDDGAALAQLDAGQIDGGMFDQGLLREAEAGEIAGASVLVEPAELGVYPWNTLQTTRSWAEEHPEEAAGFVRAIQRAMDFIRDPANKDAVIEAVVAADESLDAADMEQTYDSAGGFELYTTDPLTDADIQPAVDFLEIAQGEDITIDLAEFIDNTYLEQAQAEG